MSLIHVRNWDRYQHADTTKRGRAPVWIKLYTELLSDEDFLGLTEHRRLVLLCLWMEYARTRARLPLDTRSLTRRLQLRVTKADLKALNHAGFIEFRQDNGVTLSSLEERREEKKEHTPLLDARARNHTDSQQQVDETPTSDAESAATGHVGVPGWEPLEPPVLGSRPAAVTPIGDAPSVRRGLLFEAVVAELDEAKEGGADASN